MQAASNAFFRGAQRGANPELLDVALRPEAGLAALAFHAFEAGPGTFLEQSLRRFAGVAKVARDPHLVLRAPLQFAVADVVRRRQAAYAGGAIAGHAAAVAAVEDREEVRAVGQLAVELVELVVGHRVLARPVEVMGHEAFVLAIHFLADAVAGNLRAMAAVIEHPVLAILGAVEQPFEPLDNAPGGGPLVEDNADVVRGKAGFLEQRTHQEHVVDAAFEAVGGIGIIVDADEQRAAFWLFRFGRTHFRRLFRQHPGGTDASRARPRPVPACKPSARQTMFMVFGWRRYSPASWSSMPSTSNSASTCSKLADGSRSGAAKASSCGLNK